MSEELARAAEALSAAVRDGDVEAAAGLLYDDFTLTSSLGTGLGIDKASWLEGLGAIATEELTARDAQLRELGGVAIAVWRMGWRACVGLDDLSAPYLVTDAWVRADEGRWRLRWRSWARLSADFLRKELFA